MHHDGQLSRIANVLGLDGQSDEQAIIAKIEELRSDDLRPELRKIATDVQHLIEITGQGAPEKASPNKPPELIKAISASGLKPGSKYKLDRDPEVNEFVLSMILEGGRTYAQIADELVERFGVNRSISASSLHRYVRVMRRKHHEWR